MQLVEPDTIQFSSSIIRILKNDDDNADAKAVPSLPIFISKILALRTWSVDSNSSHCPHRKPTWSDLIYTFTFRDHTSTFSGPNTFPRSTPSHWPKLFATSTDDKPKMEKPQLLLYLIVAATLATCTALLLLGALAYWIAQAGMDWYDTCCAAITMSTEEGKNRSRRSSKRGGKKSRSSTTGVDRRALLRLLVQAFAAGMATFMIGLLGIVLVVWVWSWYALLVYLCISMVAMLGAGIVVAGGWWLAVCISLLGEAKSERGHRHERGNRGY